MFLFFLLIQFTFIFANGSFRFSDTVHSSLEVDVDELSIKRQLTVMAWFRLESLANFCFFALNHGSTMSSLHRVAFLSRLNVVPFSFAGRITIDQDESALLELPFVIGSWTHVAFTVTFTLTGGQSGYSTSATVYLVDHALKIGPHIMVLPDIPLRLFVGSESSVVLAGISPFHGHVDELAVFAQAMNAQDIITVRQSAAVPLCAAEWPGNTNIIGYFSATSNATLLKNNVDAETGVVNAVTVLRNLDNPGGGVTFDPIQQAPLNCTGTTVSPSSLPECSALEECAMCLATIGCSWCSTNECIRTSDEDGCIVDSFSIITDCAEGGAATTSTSLFDGISIQSPSPTGPQTTGTPTSAAPTTASDLDSNAVGAPPFALNELNFIILIVGSSLVLLFLIVLCVLVARLRAVNRRQRKILQTELHAVPSHGGPTLSRRQSTNKVRSRSRSRRASVRNAPANEYSSPFQSPSAGYSQFQPPSSSLSSVGNTNPYSDLELKENDEDHIYTNPNPPSSEAPGYVAGRIYNRTD